MKISSSIVSIKLPSCFRRSAQRAGWLSIVSIVSTNVQAQEPTIDKTNAVLYERVTLRPEITNFYSNPFDSDEIKVDAEIISPSGKKWSVPGFYIQPYSGKIVNGKEKIKKLGKPEWQVRLSFSEPGKHKIKITAKDKNGTRTLGTASLQISSCKFPSSVLCHLSSDSGFIHCNKTDHRYFVDNKLVMKKKFIDPDGITNTASLKQYSGEYKIDLPIGKHKITIKNTGADWFEIKQYLIPNYVEAKKTTLRVSGIAGKTKALIWIQSPYYIWSKVYEKDFKPYVYKNVCLIVKKLSQGNWNVEEFNTQSGKIKSIKKLHVGKNGELKINLPEITWDIAYRLIYQTDSTKEIINKL